MECLTKELCKKRYKARTVCIDLLMALESLDDQDCLIVLQEAMKYFDKFKDRLNNGGSDL